MKKLSICIPQYKETDEVVKPLLDSIALQQNIDFKDIEVIITNDGTDTHLSESLLNSYPFEVKYILAEHGGVSATRDRCFQEACGDYVMFCDADDMMATVFGLWIIFREIDNGGFDSLVSAFYEESVHPQTKEHFYIVRGDAQNGGIDTTFVHGKVHRRQYLLDKNIRWNKDLTIHEDSYFNCLCQRCTSQERVKYCPQPFYLWKWRDDSVCRRDFQYILKTYRNMLDSNSALVRQFVSRQMLKDAQFYATSMIFDAYYTMNTEQWLNQDNKEFRDLTEKRFKDYYVEFKSYYQNVDPQVKYQIVAGIRNRFFQEGLLLETQTFDQWIKHIEEL